MSGRDWLAVFAAALLSVLELWAVVVVVVMGLAEVGR